MAEPKELVDEAIPVEAAVVEANPAAEAVAVVASPVLEVVVAAKVVEAAVAGAAVVVLVVEQVVADRRVVGVPEPPAWAGLRFFQPPVRR